MEKHDLIDFLVLAAQQGSSDLHLTAGAPAMIRVAGAIKSVSEDAAVLSPEDTRRLVVETLKEGQRAKLENEWQLDFALQVGDLGGSAEMLATCRVRLKRIFGVSRLRLEI